MIKKISAQASPGLNKVMQYIESCPAMTKSGAITEMLIRGMQADILNIGGAHGRKGGGKNA